MKTPKVNLTGMLMGVAAGAVIGALLTLSLVDRDAPVDPAASEDAEREPLYWVAPMDPEYRRDKPGKSPMGMDLIPVYADSEETADSAPGTVRVAAEVVNNLGVRTARVQRGSLDDAIHTVGYVQYDQDRLVHIHPRVEGWIEQLYIKAAGDPVKKGEPLYELYSPALVNAQEELLLAMNRNNGRLIEAARDRLGALQLSPEFVKDLQQRREVSQTVTFYSPQEGVIDNLNIREGFFVQPGTTLMSIGALDEVWVEAEVFERQAALVAVGMPVTMTLDFLPGREWRGQVDYIYPSLDEKTRTLRLRLRFDNHDGALRPNMFAQVMLHPTASRDTLLVPREAVIRVGNQDRLVLALDEGRFRSVAVKIGRLGEQYTEILEGVAEGDLVVTSAQFLLDSESSRTSDFQRMRPATGVSPTTVWAPATVLSLMPGHRMVTAQHDAIAQWDWPAMTMDFTVAENVDFQQLREGLELHIEITRQDDGSYLITDIHIMNGEPAGGTGSGDHHHD